ncbi:MAG: hypothetical protein J5588_06360 [Bacteroidales bacterium]|nr:hypothetical protein [Bacteroidales bacterium]
MARTVKDIKDEMTAEFKSDAAVIEKYGLDTSKSFDEQFSKVSIESILFYVFAFCAWAMEKLFDTHKSEVTTYIDEMKPHSLRWYVNKVRAFRYGQALITDTDRYDDSGLTDETIAERQIVKYASAEERDGILYIKVAKDNSGTRSPLSTTEKNALEAYVNEVKDAGVRIDIRNEAAVAFKLDLQVYYNPQILSGDGTSLIAGGKPVEDAIKDYIENLPFNGEYRNMELIDKLQKIEGVVIPELGGAYSKIPGASEYTRIDAKEISYSGYYAFDKDNSNITYTVYANI